MQQMMRQYRMPTFSPYFTGGGVVATPAQTTQNNYVMTNTPASKRKLIEQQAKQVDQLLNEAFAARAELDKYVDIKGLEGQPVLKEQYDAKSGYIAVDGKNDGKIDGWSKLKNFGKGAKNLFTGLFCDKNGKPSLGKSLLTVGVGALCVVGGILCPPAGVAMLAVGGAMAAGTLAVGAYQASTAKTDEEAEKGWQNLGSGTVQALLTLFGAKSMGAASSGGRAAAAANANKTGFAKFVANAKQFFRPDKSIKWAFADAKAQVAAGGGYKAYATAAGKDMWNGAKLRVLGKSHYAESYNAKIEAIEVRINNTTDPMQKGALKHLKQAYEGVRNADDVTFAAKKEALQNAIRAVERRYGSGASDDILMTLKDVKSYAAQNARATSSATSIGDAAGASKALADDIANLEATNPVAGSPEAYKLRILKTLENRYKALYNAKTPEEQTRILNSINRINDAVVNKTYAVSTTTGTTDDVMSAYNQIATTTENYVNGAEAVLRARKTDLLNAKAILENKAQHTDTEINLAKALIKRFKSNVSTDKQYIAAVDELTASSGRIASVKNWFSAKKNNTKAKVGSFRKNVAKVATRPEAIVTGSVVNMLSAKTGATGFYGTEIKSGTERLQQLAEIDNYIGQLRHAQNELDNGRLVDIQM